MSSKTSVLTALKTAGIPRREAHAMHGRKAQIPYGSKVIKDTPVPHLAERRVITAILDMKKEGLSHNKIARVLTATGVPTKQRGKAWHKETIRRILIRENESN